MARPVILFEQTGPECVLAHFNDHRGLLAAAGNALESNAVLGSGRE
jgi:hypothetical protein